jgi:hypothetical protein
MQTLNMGSEAGGLIMFYHIKNCNISIQVKRFFIKGTARKRSSFPWGKLASL